MRAEFGYDDVFQSHANVVDAGSCGAYDLCRGRNQAVAESGRPQKRDAAMCGNGAFIVGIARKRKYRIGERENRASMSDAEAVDHSRSHRHGDLGSPSLDR
jgi:hypothetical protein